MSDICDIDQAGNVLCTYTKLEKGRENVDAVSSPSIHSTFHWLPPPRDERPRASVSTLTKPVTGG